MKHVYFLLIYYVLTFITNINELPFLFLRKSFYLVVFFEFWKLPEAPVEQNFSAFFKQFSFIQILILQEQVYQSLLIGQFTKHFPVYIVPISLIQLRKKFLFDLVRIFNLLQNIPINSQHPANNVELSSTIADLSLK